ncbi:MAG: hypothetical protein WCJ39_03205 [bacterium]
MAFDLTKIFSSPEEDLAIFDEKSIDALEFYEKDGKVYIKTFEH